MGPQGDDAGFAFAFLHLPSIILPSRLPMEVRLFRLILLFTLLPLVELTLLLRIGEWLGAGPTIGLVIATGVAGAWLARKEGGRTWRRVQEELSAGRMPGDELLQALLVFVAGLVLVTPGVLTDAAGLLLLFRPTRELVARRIRANFASRVQLRTVGFPGGPAGFDAGAGTAAGDGDRTGGRVIEIESD